MHLIFRLSAIIGDLDIPDTIDFVDNLPKSAPRLIKTHVPHALLPTQLWTKKPKVNNIHT